MNKPIAKTRYVSAQKMKEGAGVTVHRTIGTPALRNYDPFMLLDHFSSDNPDDYIAGFPSHPHRGFSTFTYMLDGIMEHEDSMGNSGKLGPGWAQLMKAASGIVHSEMPRQEAGLMRGFQLWINLPAVNKMDDPEYQEYPADAFPVYERPEYSVKVIVGSYEDITAPIVDTITRVDYLDVNIQPGQHFHYQPLPNHNSLLYVFEGGGRIDDKEVPVHTLIALGEENESIDFKAGKNGARFVYISGTPINEPVVQYGPFVMNTREEIDQAVRDYQSNNFVRTRAWIKGGKMQDKRNSK